MNGIHDLGGMDGFGRIDPERDEPVFHESWEARAFALNFASAATGYRNVDEFRHARERMDPVSYLRASYYEHILDAMERLLAEKGIIDSEQPARSFAAVPAAALEERIANGASARRPAEKAPRFQPGDEVRAKILHPTGHTRMPRYVRGRRGTVEMDHGAFVFPDSNAHHKGTDAQHVYAVVFSMRELWGPAAPAEDSVVVDLWDDYLECT